MRTSVVVLALVLSTGTSVLRAADDAPDLSALEWLSGSREGRDERGLHDFPRRILYWIDDTGALRARAEGAPGARALEWTWRRADR